MSFFTSSPKSIYQIPLAITLATFTLVGCGGATQGSASSTVRASSQAAQASSSSQIAQSSKSSQMFISSSASNSSINTSSSVGGSPVGVTPCLTCTGLIINEAVSSNVEFEDEDGDSEDWLELYNNSNQAISLASWSLTDDPMKPQQWLLPAMEIAAGKYLVVWASDKNKAVANKPLHANFKISSGGETLYLYDQTAQLKHSLVVAGLRAGTSVGLSKLNKGRAYFDAPTPGAANSDTEYLGVVGNDITFTAIGGPNSPAMVMLEGADANQTIRYTLDATIPDAKDKAYQGAVMTLENTVVRARIFADNYIPSPVRSRTFLNDADHDIPVVTLETEPVNFFDIDYGIYVLGTEYERQAPNKGANFWEDWERPIHFSFYETDGTLGIEFDAGVKIFGGWSRGLNAQKSLAFFSRTRYGTEKFKYPFFPELDYDSFNNIVLRNSGNDWMKTMLRDRAITTLMKDTDIDAQAGRPVAVYLNGEYWGLHNLREKTNEHMLAQKHDVKAGDINLLEVNATVVEGSAEGYTALIDYLTTADPSTAAFYEKVAAEIDIDNFIAYYATQIYIVNTDWPGNNIKYWNSPQTGWRWVLYDTDFGFGLSSTSSATANTLQYATGTIAQSGGGGGGFGGGALRNPAAWATLLPRTLLKNPIIQAQFINFFADQLNSSLLPANVEAVVNVMADEIASEIPQQKERWGSATNWNWQAELDKMIQFGEQRPANMWSHLQSFFKLSAPVKLTLDKIDMQAGSVSVNSLNINNSANWSGSYFAEVAVTVTATANSGYAFSHWSGGSTATTASISLKLTKATTLTPVFVEAL